MNPELSKQIAERLSKLHEGHSEPEPEGTVLNCITPETGVRLASGHVVPAAEIVTMSPISARSAGTTSIGTVSYLSVPSSDGVTLHHNVKPTLTHEGTTDPAEVMLGHGVGPSFMATPEEAGIDDVHQGDTSPDELDHEFWKSLGVNGPEDMTPDKLTEISKKLQEFQRGLKRMQREHPLTMGITVHVKHRTPKKRKRRK